MIKNTIHTDLIAAMKSKDTITLEALRYILSQIKNEEINTQKDLSDDETIRIIRKEVKKMQDAVTSFESNKRADLATEYKNQIAVMERYLPKEADDENISAAIEQIFQKNKELASANPNAMIGLCVRELKNMADSSRIAALVRSRSK